MLHIIYDFCINPSLVQFSMFPLWGEFKRNSVQRIVYCGSTSSYESHYYVHTTVLYDNTSIGAEYIDQSLKLCVATRGSYAWMELAFTCSDKVLHHTVHLQLLVMRFIVNSQGRYSFQLLHKSFSRRQCVEVAYYEGFMQNMFFIISSNEQLKEILASDFSSAWERGQVLLCNVCLTMYTAICCAKQ